MRQPEDNKTLDLLESLRRPRGRPRKEGALSAPERAQRHRNKKKVEAQAAANENAKLLAELKRAQARINDLTGALELVVAARMKGKRLSTDVLDGLHRLLISKS